MLEDSVFFSSSLQTPVSYVAAVAPIGALRRHCWNGLAASIALVRTPVLLAVIVAPQLDYTPSASGLVSLRGASQAYDTGYLVCFAFYSPIVSILVDRLHALPVDRVHQREFLCLRFLFRLLATRDP